MGMVLKWSDQWVYGVGEVVKLEATENANLGAEAVVVKLKRVYEPRARGDGYRVLVERLWPRGVRKDDLVLDDWRKELAPSTALRKWFAHDPDRWSEFKQRYRQELRAAPAPALLRDLAERAAEGTVTLLFSSHDTEHNNAVVLKDEVERAARRILSRPERHP